jgi:hypothetical protein
VEGAPMILRFTRGREKWDTIACFRENGTATWERANAGVPHDLIHFAVESTLGLRQAFYGLLASGWQIQDFGAIDPSTGRKRAIPEEAGRAEQLVGLVQSELMGVLRREDVEAMLAESSLPLLSISTEQLDQIRRAARELVWQWQQVAPGGHLELRFDVPESETSSEQRLPPTPSSLPSAGEVQPQPSHRRLLRSDRRMRHPTKRAADPLAALAAEFRARRAAGEAISIRRFCGEHRLSQKQFERCLREVDER